MYHELTKQEIRRRTRKRMAGLLAIVLVVMLVWLSSNAIGASLREQGELSVRNAILNSAKQCCAIEGAYPSSLAYLEENYGLVVNRSDYAITYEVFADNVMPNVVVLAKMRGDMVQTLIEATGSNRSSEARDGKARGRAFITLLFAVIALFLLLALLVGTSAYRAANDVRSSSDNTRLGLSLIANSIRATDGTDAVGVADGPEGLALVLTEHLGNGDYETRLYAYQGAIVEEYTRAGTAFTPEKAREIVRSSTFDFTYTDGLLTVHTDQGSTSVALRSVRGGA